MISEKNRVSELEDSCSETAACLWSTASYQKAYRTALLTVNQTPRGYRSTPMPSRWPWCMLSICRPVQKRWSAGGDGRPRGRSL